VTKKEKLYSTF